MKARQPELMAIPQFDSGRWKLRLERLPASADDRPNNEHILHDIATVIRKRIFLSLASDFDQTLSFNDSGYLLCDLLGIRGFEEKVAGLAKLKDDVPANPNTLRR